MLSSNDLNCRCDCCAYWRRHVHKVAAKADSKVGKVKSKLVVALKERDSYRAKLKWAHTSFIDVSDRLRKVEATRERSNRRGVLNFLFG